MLQIVRIWTSDSVEIWSPSRKSLPRLSKSAYPGALHIEGFPTEVFRRQFVIENTEPFNDDPLQKAVHDLEVAEGHLANAQSEEATAEHDVAEAIKEVKDAERAHDTVTVHVIHVNEVEKASFPERLTATLQQVWEKSYVELKIPPKPKDVFQTADKNPKSLMSFLSLTLEQAHQQKVIEDYCFGIASETGGA